MCVYVWCVYMCGVCAGGGGGGMYIVSICCVCVEAIKYYAHEMAVTHTSHL